MQVDVAILGNGVSGYSCAVQLAKRGFVSLLIGPGGVVDRPPLSKQVLVTGVPVLLSTPEKLAERSVLCLDGVVTAVDLEHRRIEVSVSDGHETVTAREIVVALGLDYSITPFDAQGAVVPSTPQGALQLVTRLDSPRDILVVGGGLVGVESAATLAGRGHQVRVIDVAARPLDRFHDPLPDLAAEYLAELGIAFTGGVGVDSVLDDGSAAEVRTRTHGTLTADAVLVATGGRPTLPPGLDQLEWPAPVDSDLRLPGHDHVYVVGDLAAPVHAHHGRLPMPHWDMAVRTGVKAAQTIAGEHASLDHVPYWWSEIGEHRLAEYGVASAAESWELEDGLYVGRDAEGDVAAVLVVDEPQRVRQARAMLSRR